ncbi:MAG TPA: SDR family oxidoreductase [candidate division Zixibacteria bacterium]|nr:SDR family oxidoreductase [candidate division Zixibacteria bacterium]
MTIKENLNIVITGASSGIGEAIAFEMAKSKHNFFLIARNKERLAKIASKLDEMGNPVHYAIGDVGNSEDVEKISEYIEKAFGDKVDVFVANAGVGFFGNLEDITEEQFDLQFNTNVKGVFLWLKKILPKMKKNNSGQIIVMSSNLGLKTSARASIYVGTKHAVQAMVGSIREELKDTNVKAATINPGSVNTPWFDGKEVDRNKMLSPNDIAKAARFIIEQEETSNIDHIHLLPGKR